MFIIIARFGYIPIYVCVCIVQINNNKIKSKIVAINLLPQQQLPCTRKSYFESDSSKDWSLPTYLTDSTCIDHAMHQIIFATIIFYSPVHIHIYTIHIHINCAPTPFLLNVNIILIKKSCPIILFISRYNFFFTIFEKMYSWELSNNILNKIIRFCIQTLYP